MTSPDRIDGFAAAFKPTMGGDFVRGAGALAGLIALLALLTGSGLFLAVALVPLGVSIYHLPMARKNDPQVLITGQGVTIDGLGTFPWSAITHIRPLTIWLRTLEMKYVVLELNGTIAATRLAGSAPPLWRWAMVRCFKPHGPHEIWIDFTTLNAARDDALAAMEHWSSSAN